MKRILVPLEVLLTAGVFTLAVVVPYFTATADRNIPDNNRESDLPPFSKKTIDKSEFLAQRAEAIGLKRGVEKGKLADPKLRQKAIREMERQEAAIAARPDSPEKESLLGSWTAIGPAPIPNGQVAAGAATTASGRVISIAVHPTNPDIVYVGAAQGGLYRTTNGGIT